MAQVDALRFLAHLSQLFAPEIQEGQVFIAYINEDNSFTVQADNVITHLNASSLNSEQFEDIQNRILALVKQADALETFCNNIPALQAQIQSLTGSTDQEGAIEFDYAFTRSEINDIKADIITLQLQVQQLSSAVEA